MGKITHKELLEAGVHMGHLTRKWDPRMAPYVFMEKNGIHVIDLNQTINSLESVSDMLQNIARSGRKILFVATKRQARNVVSEEADRLNMPFVTERWLGGMLTNFATIRKSIKRMSAIEKMEKDPEFIKNMAKRERLMISREKDKLARILGGIADLNRIPAAMFIVDVKKEHIAVKEAKKLNIPIFALVDTNSNPTDIDHVIPGNDDSTKSITLITKTIAAAIEKGLAERSKKKAAEKEGSSEKETKPEAEAESKKEEKPKEKKEVKA